MQIGYLNIFILNGRENYQKKDRNPIYNIIDFDDKIGLNDWHHFCISINVIDNIAFVAQNGKIIAKRRFDPNVNHTTQLKRLMPYAELGPLTGSIADIQIYSKPLTEEE